MILCEFYKVRTDETILYRTYSDANKYIERDGVLYAEAVDPMDSNRVYTETDIEIEEEE